MQPRLLRLSARSGRAVLACAVVSSIAWASPFTIDASHRVPTGGRDSDKHALIVAIADYPRASGYDVINSQNDVPIVAAALEAHGFPASNTVVVLDEEATRAGIVSAIESLTARVSPGDVVVVHYSGHGHRMTDDDQDEADGLDELLVPYDAPGLGVAADDYRGERHLRDDDFGRLLTELRRALGSEGNLLVTLDACFSGSGTRATHELPVRGVAQPLRGRVSTGAGGGGDAASGVIDRRESRAVEGLAPYAVISASRHDEVARETRMDDGRIVGPLSYALSSALSRARSGSSYRMLFEAIRVHMAGTVPSQSPQIEGYPDTELFNGEVVAQAPYFSVTDVLSDTLIALRGGTLVGLHPGTRIELHAPGTTQIGESTPWASGTVVLASAVHSEVRLEGIDQGRTLATSLAFPTEYAFPDQTVRVAFDSDLPMERGRALRDILGAVEAVAVVEEAPDLVVGVNGSSMELRDASSDRLLTRVSDASLVDAVKGFAQNTYLRRLAGRPPPSGELEVRLELIPSSHRWDRNGACRAEDSSMSTPIKDVEGGIVLGLEDEYVIRVHNNSEVPAHVTLLDLVPDGSINILFPLPEYSAPGEEIGPGESYLIPLCYYATPPVGNEVLLLLATTDFVDLTPVISTRGASRASGREHPLQSLLHGGFDGTPTRSGYGRTDDTGFAVSSVSLRIVDSGRRE